MSGRFKKEVGFGGNSKSKRSDPIPSSPNNRQMQEGDDSTANQDEQRPMESGPTPTQLYD